MRTQPDELVGTDLPIVAYLADRRVPGQLVDSSFVRLGVGSLTDGEILASWTCTTFARLSSVGSTPSGRP